MESSEDDYFGDTCWTGKPTGPASPMVGLHYLETLTTNITGNT